MQDYAITKCSRKCAVSGRGLEPGETYYSLIVRRAGEMARLDVAADQWSGPQDDAIGWWRSHMPAAGTRRLRPAPNGVLLDTLSELLERPGQECLAYLLALFLVRRRVLSEEQSLNDEPTDQPTATWNLVCPADGRQWNVPIVAPTASTAETLQDRLTTLLFTEE